MKVSPLKGISVTLCLVTLATNCVLANSVETNFWKERNRRSERTDVANLPLNLPNNPAQILTGLPDLLPEKLESNIPRQVLNQLPRGANGELPALLKALPTQLGNIRKVSVPIGKLSKQTVIHIQDVHLNSEAQENIGETVKKLMGEKKVDLVALEGAFAPIDLSRFNAFDDQESIRVVADYFIKENKISGPVHAAMTHTSKTPPVVGVDDQIHYQANLDAYLKSVPLRSTFKDELKVQEKKLLEEKSQYFNALLAEFDRAVQSHRQEVLSLGEYVKVLIRHSSLAIDLSIETFLEAYKLETSINFTQIETERAALLRKLLEKLKHAESSNLVNASIAYRLGNIGHKDFYTYLSALCADHGLNLRQYQAMDSYIQYVLLAEGINSEKLMTEINAMEKEVFSSLIKTKHEESLVEKSKKLYLTGKLLDFALTPEEWKEYSELETLNPQLKFFESFYTEAEARNHAMTENTLNAMEKNFS